MTKVESNEVCEWAQNGDETGYYSSGCWGRFYFNDYGIVGNGFKFCPFCGKVIEEIKWEFE